MKKALTSLALFAMMIGTASAQTAPVTAPPPAPMAPAPVAPPVSAPAMAPAAAAPQVNIAVGIFKCQVSGCSSQLGVGLSDALMNALSDTGNFAVYERENVPQLAGEQFIAGNNPGVAISPVDVLVFGNVTSYGEDNASGNACFLGVCLGGKQSTIAVSLRIVDAKTSRVIATTTAEGKSNSNAASLNFHGLSLGGNKSSGVDKAVGAMLVQAVQNLQAKIPANYYR